VIMNLVMKTARPRDLPGAARRKAFAGTPTHMSAMIAMSVRLTASVPRMD